MKYTMWLLVGFCGGILSVARAPAVRADEIPAEYRPCIHKALIWLAKQQAVDGHWEAAGGQYLTAMTALSGMSFLMEGSTLREGRYSDRIRRAVDWLINQSMPNGLIGNPGQGHYMYGHGYSVMFLACVYGEEGNSELRRKLEDVLTRAVQFTGKSQSSHGGWHYISAAETSPGGDSSSSVTQMQALRAARNVGIVVPKEIIVNGLAYLRNTSNTQGGVAYGWNSRGGEGSPALTAAALASAFGAGQYDSELVKKWLQFCQKRIPLNSLDQERLGHDEYIHYYLAQIMYCLGEDRYAKLFPHSLPQERLTWSKYRKAVFGKLLLSQASDGSWAGAGIGPVYGTAMSLAILQLDNGSLPLYQR